MVSRDSARLTGRWKPFFIISIASGDFLPQESQKGRVETTDMLFGAGETTVMMWGSAEAMGVMSVSRMCRISQRSNRLTG